MKLNLGCGAHVIDSWINVDYALGAKFMKIPFFKLINKKLQIFKLDWDQRIFIHNLTQVFPWNENSIDVIYSSHTLEHLNKNDGIFFLNECYRVLRPGGIIRIIVPDLQSFVNRYINHQISADNFLEDLYVLREEKGNFIKKIISYYMQYPHKCMYDSRTLNLIMKEIGFISQTKKAFDSKIEDINLIELENRTESAVIIEGTKPY